MTTESGLSGRSVTKSDDLEHGIGHGCAKRCSRKEPEWRDEADYFGATGWGL